MAEVKSAKQKVAEEQERARLAQAPGLHPKEPCDGCDEKKKEQRKKKVEKKSEKDSKQDGGMRI